MRMSMSTMSKPPWAAAATASAPVAAKVTTAPRVLSRSRASSWLTGSSSATSTRAPRRASTAVAGTATSLASSVARGNARLNQDHQSRRQHLPQQGVVGGGDDLAQQPLVVDGCALLRGDGGDRAVEQRDQRGIAPAHHDLQREVDVGDPDELDPPWREALDLLVQHR
jgi:hypothetical protein